MGGTSAHTLDYAIFARDRKGGNDVLWETQRKRSWVSVDHRSLCVGEVTRATLLLPRPALTQALVCQWPQLGPSSSLNKPGRGWIKRPTLLSGFDKDDRVLSVQCLWQPSSCHGERDPLCVHSGLSDRGARCVWRACPLDTARSRVQGLPRGGASHKG